MVPFGQATSPKSYGATSGENREVPQLPRELETPALSEDDGLKTLGPATTVDEQDTQIGRKRTVASVAHKSWELVRKQASFIGPGLVSSVAYIDPGNWATDLQAGAQFRYSQLFVVLLSGLFAILLQTMSSRLGIVSGRDLAECCRERFHNRPHNKLKWRWGVLYPLYFLAESAIIFTDLAELLGSAIALTLIFPKLPLWAGVLLTSADIFIVLLFFSAYPSEGAKRSMHIFELGIGLLVFVVLGCFAVLLNRVDPDWGDAFRNYLPNSGVVESGGLFIAVGIIGATVMPHAIFLGSKLATVDRLPDEPESLLNYGSQKEQAEAEAKRLRESRDPNRASVPLTRARSSSFGPSLHMPQPRRMPRLPLPAATRGRPTGTLESTAETEEEREESEALRPKLAPSAKYIRTYLRHATFDIGISLIAFALVINSAILIVAAAAFYDQDGNDGVINGDLFSAHELLGRLVGSGPAFLFALALLLSGQCASVTVTLAGQIISEGFLHWSVSPFLRRLITRLIGMVPSLIVAVVVGRDGLDTLLVASQVALSLVLPFVIAPLLIFTTDAKLMSVPVSAGQVTAPSLERSRSSDRAPTSEQPAPSKSWTRRLNPFRARESPLADHVSFANRPWSIVLGWAVWIVVVAANLLALVELGMGNT